MTNLVIIGRGRRALVQQTIDSLYTNTDQGQFNCVFVSDSEDDYRVSKLLRSVTRKNFSLLEISNSGHTLSQIKNLGVAWAAQRWGYKPGTPHHAYDGDYLGVFDNDVCFLPGWLPRMIDALTRSDFGEGRKVALVGGCRHPFHGINKLWGDESYIESTDAVAGYSHFMRYETWECYGPYPRACAPGIGQSEDFWFSRQIVESGNDVGYVNPPVLAHCGITDSNGRLAIGSDQIVRVPGVLYE